LAEEYQKMRARWSSLWKRFEKLVQGWTTILRRQPAVAAEEAMVSERTTRRNLLRGLSALPFLGALGRSSAATAAEKKRADAVSEPTHIHVRDQREYTRLRTLDLTDPAVMARQQRMPTGRIGNLTLGRLISGSNLISMNMHARDLHYVRALAAHYNTDERIFMTLKRCEELGVNGIVLKSHNFRHFPLARYWTDWGGQMKWIADVITTDINKYERLLVEHLELGASAAYLWGGASDIWYHEKKQDNIIRAYEMMRRYDVPVGIGAHRLEPIAFCEREGLEPDFYIKTLHHDQYWSAHPKSQRRFMEMYEPDSPNHDEYHDNLFCHEHEETVEFMREVKVPWIAFKILAAGAIKPKDGFQFAFDSGADFVCVGMFDFQVEEDAELTRKYVASAQNRTRLWC
jgi:hypothetical protein